MKDPLNLRLLIYYVLTSDMEELYVSEVQWYLIKSKVQST